MPPAASVAVMKTHHPLCKAADTALMGLLKCVRLRHCRCASGFRRAAGQGALGHVEDPAQSNHRAGAHIHLRALCLPGPCGANILPLHAPTACYNLLPRCSGRQACIVRPSLAIVPRGLRTCAWLCRASLLLAAPAGAQAPGHPTPTPTPCSQSCLHLCSRPTQRPGSMSTTPTRLW